jgi:glucosamine--fructose-6-phosphate aminotransferase (isomerizing)
MCGIVGYVGKNEAVPFLLDGLRRLEYRGYDSVGVALVRPGAVEVDVIRTIERITGLETTVRKLNGYALGARAGIGHTRWATHGRPSVANAHPHRSSNGKVAVVHNGIFENFAAIQEILAAHGHVPQSDTDTECFPMLLSHLMSQGRDFNGAFFDTVRTMNGKYAIACVHADHPGKVLLARSGPPLVVGIGEGEFFVASDVTPLLSHTRKVIFLEDGDKCEVSEKGIRFWDQDERPVSRAVRIVDWDATSTEVGSHDHFMQKEIFEQPEAIARTIDAYVSGDEVSLGPEFSDEFGTGIERVSILACGTSWHAGLVGKFLIERLARLPVDVDYASEFRYREPVVRSETIAIAISQSGETADTVGALSEAASRGARTVAICNSVGSQVARLADLSLFTRAGVEIGVASTKAFTTQLAVLILLAIRLGRIRGTLSQTESTALVRELRGLPSRAERVHSLNDPVRTLAAQWFRTPSALFLGRGSLFPVALEGALKLKEIAYVQAQGYPAGEMKHGPIALIDDKMPVLVLVPQDENRARMLSNVQEAVARGAPVLAVADAGETSLDAIARTVIRMAPVHPLLAPILYTIPLQLFAYHVAVLRGCDVDRPRNLAKSVTVE